MDVHSAKVDAAIWAMLRQGMGPKAIMDALARDEAGIGYPVDLARSTFYDRKRRLLKREGDPTLIVDAGSEDEAAAAIRREALGAMRAQVRRLRGKESLTQTEAGTLGTILKAVDGYERRREADAAAKQHSANTADREGSTSPLLHRLTREMRSDVEEREAETVTET